MSTVRSELASGAGSTVRSELASGAGSTVRSELASGAGSTVRSELASGAGSAAVALAPSRGRLLIAGAAPIVLIALLVWRWSTVDAGTDAMVRADRMWLIGALLTV